ncbi:hypothetical protein M3J09_009312 [Ascochyta lentis]
MSGFSHSNLMNESQSTRPVQSLPSGLSFGMSQVLHRFRYDHGWLECRLQASRIFTKDLLTVVLRQGNITTGVQLLASCIPTSANKSLALRVNFPGTWSFLNGPSRR